VKYGTVSLNVQYGSINITKEKRQEIRHYPGTDKNDVINNGRGATTITCTLIAHDDTERVLLEQILHDDAQAELEIGTFKYKQVVTGGSSPARPATYDMNKWIIDATFIALDPIPYDITTGGALY
jgi:hypothetical protein